MIVKSIGKHGSVKSWLRILIFSVLLGALLLIGIFAPASADGAMQISGVAFFDAAGNCSDPEGAGSDFGVLMTGDLEGCLYVFVESAKCSPGGVYVEKGTETFVGQDGTFRTTYRVEQKYQDCPNLIGEIHGRCQHPIIAGSGTGDYKDVTGRLDFKDDIESGNFPYSGHLK